MENSLLKYPLSNWDTLPANPVLPPDWAGNETHESPASRGAEIYRIPTVSGKEVKNPAPALKWPQKVRQYSEAKIVQAAERACCLWIAGGKPFSFALILRLL